MVAAADERQRLLQEVSIDYGLEIFEGHPSGIRLPKDGVAALLQAARECESFPQWSVLLEGHCPGRPEENNAIRQSVGEEVADLCKAQLEEQGVRNAIVCSGLGSAQGLGARVRLYLVKPEGPSPEELAAAKKAEEEAAAAALRAAEAEASAKKFAEEEAMAAKKAEEEAAWAKKKAEEDAAAAKKAQEEAVAAAKKAEVEAAEAKKAEEEAAAAKTKADEEAAAARKAEEEAAAAAKEADERATVENVRKAEEAATAAQLANEEAAAAQKKAEDDAAAANKAEEEAVEAEKSKKIEADEAAAAEAAAKKAEEEAAAAAVAAKVAEDEAAAAKQAEEDAAKAAVEKAEEEAAAQATLKAEEEAAEATRKAEEEAAAKKKAEEEAAAEAARKAEEQAAAKKKAEDEAAAESARKAEQEAAMAATKTSEDEHEKAKHRWSLALDSVETDAPIALERAESGQTGIERCETAAPPCETAATPRGGEANIESPRKAAEPTSPGLEAPQPGLSLAETTTFAMRPDSPDDDDDLVIPDVTGLPWEERARIIQDLLDKLLERPLQFEPNKAELEQSASTIKRLARVLKAFPDIGVWCVGHAKGRPADSNDAKRTLSHSRTEAVRDALQERGAQNTILCAGFGSVFSLGMCVKLHVLEPKEVEDSKAHGGELLKIPCIDGLLVEQQGAALNQLLKEALEPSKLAGILGAMGGSKLGGIMSASGGLTFEPNRASIQTSALPVVRRLACILKSFPSWMIRCDGHTKGSPSENNDAKRQLSQVRAEALKASLQDMGVVNNIICVGQGCSHGIGMCVRMYATEPESEIEIPNTVGMSRDEQTDLMNKLLEKALKRNIEFEPNKSEIPQSGIGTIQSIARVLRAFPELSVRCEGHAKGRAAEDSEAKQRLSHARAEAVHAAVKLEGVVNGIRCIGEGSAQGLGMCVRMFAIEPEELRTDDIHIPETKGMPQDKQVTLLNELLEKALAKQIEFEPNVHDVPLSAMLTIRNIARVLMAFPGLNIKCEAHAKGKPHENNEAKKKLSHLRAESVKAAVKAEGAENEIHCVGEGCARGLGVCVRMFYIDPEELKKNELQIPDTANMSKQEREKVLNELLVTALEPNITFEPNSTEIQATSLSVVAAVVRVLKAFPDFAVRCEGHAKGKPADNNSAKVKLSQVRAEAVKTALAAGGVTNEIVCIGQGCVQGLGMCVRMFAVDEPKA